MTRTEWFPQLVRPVRVGYYEVNCPLGCGMHYWDGEYWYENAGAKAIGHNFLNERPWRGLTEEAK